MRRQSTKRFFAHGAVFALVVQVLTVGFLVAPKFQPVASAAPTIQLTKTAPRSVLAGADATYRLTVTNPGDTVEFNVSFSDVLPNEARFVAGSVVPASAGNPRVSINPDTSQQVLQWLNVADLGPSASTSIEFKVTLGEAGKEVGNTLINNSFAASQTNPRVVPRFNAAGVPVPGSYTESANAAASTNVSAVQIEKSSTNAPEGELLRGVHDQRSTYTLTATNNFVAATTGISVVDYLPAGLEFLGCGTSDNTAPPSLVEYPGAPRLGVPPLDLGSTCLTPISVDTVTDPAPNNGVVYPEGVYTRVEWSLGDLAAGATAEIRYVAGIPLKENTDSWVGAKPTDTSGQQGSNLNNNSGPSTRELLTEATLTNFASLTGTYTAAPVGSDPIATSEDSKTVSIEDVRMRKAVAPTAFASDGGSDIATFTLTVDTSEYVTAAGIVITDTLPDGYCPLGGSSNFAPGSPAECNPGGGSAPSTPFSSVAYEASTGAYNIVFSPLSLGDNSTTTVSFQARMRSVYTAGDQAGLPTVAGDSFTNRASLGATTTPIPNSSESGPQAVTDTSSATQNTAAPTLDKELKPRDTSLPQSGNPLVDCALGTAPAYGEPSEFTPEQLTFRQGDQICFKLRVEFPSTLKTRAPVLSDYFPVDTGYVVNSYAPTAANTVTIAQFVPPVDTPGIGVWTLGDLQNGVRFAGAGDVFEVVVAVTVLEPAAPPKPDLLGNLMKLRTEDSAGRVLSTRDSVDFSVAPGPNMGVTKGVYSVDSPANGPNPPNTDGSTITEDSTATFRVDLANRGREGFPGANYSVRGIGTWDVLPVGITCAAVSDFAVATHGVLPAPTVLSTVPLPGGIATCTNPGNPGHPAVSSAYGDSTVQSVIVWSFPTPDSADTYSLEVNETMSLTYQMRLPSQISVSTRFDNVAAIESFRSFTNIADETSEYYPAQNINPDAVPLENVDPASDTSFVVSPDAAMTKTVVTQIEESNNNLPSQATIGEQVTYTIGVTVPAHSTVYNGVLTDPMPTGLTFVSATAGFSATGTPPVSALPGGFSLDGATGTLSFPATYQNTTSTDQLFQVTIVAQTSTLSSNKSGTVRTNTASFASTSALSGGSSLPARTAQAAVTVVEPNPTIAKAANPTTVIGGQIVTYTLTAGNSNSRPPSHDTLVIDCLPAEITFNAVTLNQGGTAATEPGSGSNGCEVGQTRLRWEAGTVLAGSSNRKLLRYTGIVTPDAVGAARYTNTATLTGTTLNNGYTPSPDERVYTKTASATVNVTTLTITKGVFPEQATIGEQIDYTATVKIPKSTSFFNTSILDVLPAGLDTAFPNFTTTSVTCVLSGTSTPCTGLDPNFGTPLTPSGQTVGWFAGALPADAVNDRLITVAYSTVVLDNPANVAGARRTNSATAKWSLDGEVPAPTTVTEAAALAESAGPAVAVLSILEPQLSIEKTVSDQTPQAGEVFDYSVTVTNGSGATVSQAWEIAVADDVPVGVIVDPTSISNGGILTGSDPTLGNGQITWTGGGPLGLGPLDPGESLTLTYSATLAASENLTGDALTNTAEITEYASLPVFFTDRRTYTGPDASATVTPAFPAFSVTKSTPGGQFASLGEEFSWAFEVTNTGNADGFSVNASDTLPANWTYVPGSAVLTNPQPGGTPVSVEPTFGISVPEVQNLLWTDFGDLPIGQTARFEYRAIPTAEVVTNPGVGFANPSTNTVFAEGKDAAGATGNAGGPFVSPVATADALIASADIAITKLPPTATVNAGGEAIWTLEVSNLGPDPAAGPFSVTDSLPPGFGFVSATGTGWTCALQSDQSTILCSNDRDMEPSDRLPVITVVTQVPTGLPAGTEFTNTANVTSSNYDPDPVNNTDSATVTLLPSADLAISKTSSPPAVAGTNLSYTLQVSNLGPDTSQATEGEPIVVSDTLPGNFGFVSAVGTDWACSAVGQLVTCLRSTDLASGTDAPPITVTAAIPATDPAQSVVNTATVTPEITPDPVPENNTDSVTDEVTRSADLAITKSHTGAVDYLGNVTFTLAVTNLGPSTSEGVTVTDTLPAGLTPLSVAGTEPSSTWNCVLVEQSVTCSLDSALAVGAAEAILVTAQVGAAAVPQVINSATVSAITPDPDLANNTDTDPVDVAPLVDLSIEKSHTGDFLVGSQGTFTLQVANAGPTQDPGPITVVDTLPAGLQFVSATGTGWSCAEASQLVTCTTAEALAVGAAAAPISVVVDVLPAAYPQASNSATVSSAATDTNPENNTDSDTVTVTARVDISVTKTGSITSDRVATWTIAVANAGPSSTVGPTTVTDPLPAGLSFVSAGGNGWTCTEANSLVTCTYAGLIPAGSSAGFTLVSRVTAAPGTVIVNVANAQTPAAVESASESAGCAAGADTCGQGKVTVPGTASPLALTGSEVAGLLLLALGLLGVGAWVVWGASESNPIRRRLLRTLRG
jgi:fimbrial isopeptide formation D2 family protein/uncharacterized repeat protein (TIGR01451 family)